MKRPSVLILLMLLFLNAVQVAAQDKKKKNDTTRFFLFPEFYTYWPVEINDTILKYECADISHNPLNVDTLRTLNDVRFITFIKTYNDYLHTFIDPEGKPRPVPVSKILYRYERTGANIWTAFDNLNNYTTVLQEDPGKIVRSDTTILANPVTGNKQMTIRRYYKVAEIEQSGVTNVEKSVFQKGASNNAGTENSTAITFFVPEFYFPSKKQIKDTTLEFLCYDSRDTLIPVVTDFDSVRYFSLFKSFVDSAHTYNDEGVKKPLPVSIIVKRYDRIAKEKWMSVEYPSNKYTELKGFRDNIVKTDSVTSTDPISGTETKRIYNYYKVIKN